MSLEDVFGERNPFDNLTVAGSANAKFPLRGHEDLLDQRLREVLQAIDEPDYPATAQHTIVFGEWGHGKSHLLRSFEHLINTKRPEKAKAVFFEPADSEPKDIFDDLCKRLEIIASNAGEFIAAVSKKYPENLFLLIDETQAVVGEELSEDLESNLNGYWGFLGELQKKANDQVYGLHIFHGLSANSARAINRIGQIPTIREFQKYIFTLQSLTEEEQWEMFVDHLKEGANDPDFRPEDILRRGVCQALNELTGGNPRYSLSLMSRIFEVSKARGAVQIDGSMCYETLLETPRFDSTSSNYFDKNRIDQILVELNQGLQSEKKIAKLLERKISTLLGEWKGVQQETLEEFDLTTASIRTLCSSLRQQMPVFEQPRGATEFRLRHAFLNSIGVIRQNTLTENQDRTLLLKLQLEPETLIPDMMMGLNKVMAFNSHPGELMPLDILGAPNRLYKTSVSQGVPVQVALNVFKGKEVPIELYDKILGPIEAEEFTVMLLIEDADTTHDLPGSSWQKFRESYTGPIDLESRFVFINGTDPEGKQFDEDFFVRLATNSIEEDEAHDWFNRLQIDQQLSRIEADCIYCPSEDERVLIDELTAQGRSFTIREIKELQDSFHWVSRPRLEKLALYVSKNGSAYCIPPIEQIPPIKSILLKLQQSGGGVAEGEIDRGLAARFIRTGDTQSIRSHTGWLLELLKRYDKVKFENERYCYRDLESEFQSLEGNYQIHEAKLKQEISVYRTAGIDITKLGQCEISLKEIQERINAIEFDPVEQKIPEYEAKSHELDKIQSDLSEVPDLARAELARQFEELKILDFAVSEKTHWSDSEKNPYETLYGLGKMQNTIAELENQISESVPQQKQCRQQIISTKMKLNALKKLLENELSSGSFAGAKMDQCIFDLFNAVRDGKNGIVTVHFS